MRVTALALAVLALVALLAAAAIAKPRPSEATIWSPQGWPIGVRGHG